jgi:hypothetical protein
MRKHQIKFFICQWNNAFYLLTKNGAHGWLIVGL